MRRSKSTPKAGYTLPAHMMNVRFVHLPDDVDGTGQGRREVLLYYVEDMAPTGLTTNDLLTDNVTNARWAPIERGLIGRASKAFSVGR